MPYVNLVFWANGRRLLFRLPIVITSYSIHYTKLYDGEEDFVIGLCSLLSEIGMIPVIVGSGARSGMLRSQIAALFPDKTNEIQVLDEADFEWMAECCRANKPDIIIGHSKGYTIARELNIPLVRVGFPIHDRLGGQRLLHSYNFV